MPIIDWGTSILISKYQQPEPRYIKIPLDRQLPDKIKEILSIRPCYVAGGAARQLYQNKPFDTDIDIFPHNRQSGKIICKNLKEFEIEQSEYARTFSIDKYTIQVVNNNPWKDVDQIFDDFDFRVCCFAFDLNNLYYRETALEDLNNNICILNCSYFKIYRVIKYLNKGFKIEDKLKDLFREHIVRIIKEPWWNDQAFCKCSDFEDYLKERLNERIWYNNEFQF